MTVAPKLKHSSELPKADFSDSLSEWMPDPHRLITRSDDGCIEGTSYASDDPVQRPAGRGELIDSTSHVWVFDQRRSVMRLDASVDHKRPRAAPVLLIGEGSDTIDVGGGIRPRKRHPQPVVERPRRELAVIDDDDEGERVEG